MIENTNALVGSFGKSAISMIENIKAVVETNHTAKPTPISKRAQTSCFDIIRLPNVSVFIYIEKAKNCNETHLAL